MGIEFTLRSLRDLAKRATEDPAIVESDWRRLFHETFDLNEQQAEVLKKMALEDATRIQETFRAAAQVVRGGGEMKLKVFNEPALGRRILRLETNKVRASLSRDLETQPEDPGDSSAILCCCADCKCWHFCGSRNPCSKPECR